MSGGLNIAELKGTPLYALAKNANIYGGRELSKTEMVFFRQQCQEMGFEPAKYGLEIESEDMEGASAKETRRNAEELNELVQNAYKGQFGKKGIEPAKMAETKAYAMIKVAKEAFERNHKGLMFTPENLGTKPNFREPKYKDNLTEYAVDLNSWAKDVCTQYNDADHMSNEQLTALILANDNKNAGQLNDKIDNASQNIVEKVIDQGDLTRQAVHNEGAATRKTVHNEGAATRRVVHQEGAATRATVRAEADALHDHIDGAAAGIHLHIDDAADGLHEHIAYEGGLTRKVVRNENAATRKTVRATSQETQELNGISEKITTNISDGAMFPHTQGTKDRVNNMRNKILQSNAPFEQKKEALTHLAAFSTQVVMNDVELAQEEMKIQGMLNPSENPSDIAKSFRKTGERVGGAVGKFSSNGIIQNNSIPQDEPYTSFQPNLNSDNPADADSDASTKPYKK